MTEAALLELLAQRFAAPEWAFFSHIAGGTGRIADGLAINLWTTRGQEIHGSEVKCARNDWLQELRTPRKQEEGLFKYCDRFWVVAPKGVVRKDEVPPNWGWLAPQGVRLVQQVGAPKLVTPAPIDRMFMTRLLVRAFKIETNRTLREDDRLRGSNDYQRGLVDGEERWREINKASGENAARLQERLEAFERVSGISIDGYHDDVVQIGKLVAFLLRSGNLMHVTHYLENGLSQLRDFESRLEDVIKGVKETAQSLNPAAVTKVSV